MDGRDQRDPEDRDRQPADGDDKPRLWRRPSRTQAFWICFVLVLIFAAKFIDSVPSDVSLVSYRQYRE